MALLVALPSPGWSIAGRTDAIFCPYRAQERVSSWHANCPKLGSDSRGPILSFHTAWVDLGQSDPQGLRPQCACCRHPADTWPPAGHRRFSALYRPQQLSASEKGDVQLCGAAEGIRPAIAGQRASGNRRGTYTLSSAEASVAGRPGDRPRSDDPWRVRMLSGVAIAARGVGLLVFLPGRAVVGGVRITRRRGRAHCAESHHAKFFQSVQKHRISRLAAGLAGCALRRCLGRDRGRIKAH